MRFPKAQICQKTVVDTLTALVFGQFVTLTGFADCIMEYNQEQLRVKSLDGGTSLVRSFPSRVAVRIRLELGRVGLLPRFGFKTPHQ